MTERIYYTDPYLTEFEAEVLALDTTADGRRCAILNRTAFYPTSGGQPHDTGMLGWARIVDVVERDDGIILHLFDGDMPAGRIRGRIDWARRFEHMQQHTGQHVLSAAFDRIVDSRTVSFHLGSATSTIDLSSEVAAEEIVRAESEANRIVWEDRPVHIRFVSAEEALRLPLRKEPARGGELRLIDVDGFDLSACGGTHVSRTGAIGTIAVTSWERFRGGTRVEFVCGIRALGGYRALRDSVAACTKLLSVLPNELAGSIERLQGEARDLKRQNKELRAALTAFEADRLAATAERKNGVAWVVSALEGWDAQGLKLIASHIVTRGGHVAVLFDRATPAALVVARSGDVAFDSSMALKKIVGRFGGKGGGRPELAQGGGLQGDAEAIAGFVRDSLLNDAAAEA